MFIVVIVSILTLEFSRRHHCRLTELLAQLQTLWLAIKSLAAILFPRNFIVRNIFMTMFSSAQRTGHRLGERIVLLRAALRQPMDKLIMIPQFADVLSTVFLLQHTELWRPPQNSGRVTVNRDPINKEKQERICWVNYETLMAQWLVMFPCVDQQLNIRSFVFFMLFL